MTLPDTASPANQEAAQALDDTLVPFLKTNVGKIANALLQDIRRLRDDEQELFETLFYDRHSDTEELIKYIQDSHALGENILVVGSAGFGKTCLLLRCLHDALLRRKDKLYSMFCDCRDEGQPLPGLAVMRESLTNKLITYLHALSREGVEAILPADLMTAHEPHERFRRAVNGILKLKRKDVALLYPVLFVDDIDYSEYGVQEELLSMLLPLLQSRNMVVIYAVRPPASRTIDYAIDKRITMAFTKARKLFLDPVSVRGLIATRLAFLLEKPNAAADDDLLELLISKVMRRTDPLVRYLQPYLGEHSVESIRDSRFPYCFNGRVETLMQNITNGNINEMVDIAIALLCYCHKERKTLETNPDGTFELHREDVIKALTAPESNYPLINIHEVKSQRKGRSPRFQNNSTLQNVLEMFCVTNYVDESFFDRLCGPVGREDKEGFGHTRAEVIRAVRFCLDTRLVEELLSASGPTLFRPKELESRDIGPYTLTEKGRYYLLDLAAWDPYVKMFGEGKRSVLSMTEEGDLGRFQLEKDILEFLSALLSVAGEPRPYLKIGKQKLYQLFEDNYGHSYWHRFESRKREDQTEGYSTLSREMFETVLKLRGLCSTHREPNRNYFVLRPTTILKLARDGGVQKGLNPDRFSADELKAFCVSYASWSSEDD